MKTLISIMAHAEAEDVFWRHFGFWHAHKKQGADLLFWMPEDNAFKVPGEELMVSGKREHDGLESIKRFYTIFEHMAKLEGYDQYALFEYDSFVLGDLPIVSDRTFVLGNKFTENSSAWKSKQFMHPPIFIGSAAIKPLVHQMGRTSFREESGMWDRWFGLVCDRAKITTQSLFATSIFDSSLGFSRNTVEDDDLPDLRRAILHGATCIHGIKSEQALRIVNETRHIRHMQNQLEGLGYTVTLPKDWQ